MSAWAFLSILISVFSILSHNEAGRYSGERTLFFLLTIVSACVGFILLVAVWMFAQARAEKEDATEKEKRGGQKSLKQALNIDNALTTRLVDDGELTDGMITTNTE